MAAATAKMSFWGSCLERDLHQHDGLHPLGCVKNRKFPVHEQRILRFQSKLWSSPAAIAVTSQIFPLREEGACLPSAHLCAALSFPAASPFTERDSFKPSRGGGRLTNQMHEQTSCSSSDESLKGSNGELIYESSSSFGNVDKDDIASHLPELKELLNLLRNDWRAQAARGPQRVGPGNVFLVGTGPGDPELLTLKALRLMQTADLVLYDRLVSTDILDMVHTGARLLYVGKTAGYHSRTQNEIHELLLSFAEAGALVLRLKGGDPLVFGRGGEEMDFLQQQGIQVKVVPGITAASGIAAELGIPLTHRGAANSVRFLTGHSQKGGSDPLHVAEQAADPESTLVVYMGLATLPALTSKLMANGLPADTPAAAIERGTTTQQRTVFAKLKELTGRVASAQLVSPTLIIIGRVVALSPFWPHMASTTEGSIEKSVNISQTQFSLDITMQRG